MDVPKIIFLTAQARVPVFYDISKYLMDKCFDIVWGYLPKNSPHQNSIFGMAKARKLTVFNIIKY